MNCAGSKEIIVVVAGDPEVRLELGFPVSSVSNGGIRNVHFRKRPCASPTSWPLRYTPTSLLLQRRPAACDGPRSFFLTSPSSPVTLIVSSTTVVSNVLSW